ncbi:serine hydrolase domain-containing protein [Terrimonas pollutisoli]|uniref:serine hydrolase domain-containing protein n=1 Tax=Terrimonas pollutisoli TaxID=3034147 RepID=UPI0023EE0E4E|nr:serine hydrolase [Terrimonas sp. H1YJ31]
MAKRKIIRRTLLLLLLLALGFAFWYGWQAAPIISGYGAKNMASAVFVQHRRLDDVLKEDLAGFPFSLGTYTVNEKDSSVTGSVWGLGKRKAIYRKGLGCTLINNCSEAEVRAQSYSLPLKQTNSDTVAWPYGDKITDSVSSSVDKKMLEQAINNVLHETTEGKPAYTRAVLVVYDGKIVGEQYAPGFDKNTVMLGWSISKSLTAALIGILVKQGKLNPDAPAPVPEWKGTDKEKITLKQLLQQTAGLDFIEDYTSPSEVTNMLFKKGDMAAFTAKLPLKNKPGTVFNYSSGNSNILSRIIRQTIGEKDYWSFPYTALFQKVNMHSVLLEPDASGTYIGSSYSYATARDFARFGLLYYNNGLWNGEQLLPDNWVRESIRPASADNRKHYGYQFWLNGFDKDDLTKRWYPDVPADMYFADGFGGQNVYIIPSKKLVVVRLGLHNINENKFLREVIAAIDN